MRSLWLSEGLQHLGSRSILPRTPETSAFVVGAARGSDQAPDTMPTDLFGERLRAFLHSPAPHIDGKKLVIEENVKDW